MDVFLSYVEMYTYEKKGGEMTRKKRRTRSNTNNRITYFTTLRHVCEHDEFLYFMKKFIFVVVVFVFLAFELYGIAFVFFCSCCFVCVKMLIA